MITVSKYDKNYILVHVSHGVEDDIVKQGTWEWSRSEMAYICPRYRIVDIVDTAKKKILGDKRYTNTGGLFDEAVKYDEELYQFEKIQKISYESILAALRAQRQTGVRLEDIEYFTNHFRGRFEPYRHQLVTFQYVTHIDRVAVFNEMGTGKTASVLWAADWRMLQKQVFSALIVAPNNILKNWEREIQFHIPHRRAVILQGSRNDRLDLLDSVSDFYIINYEGLAVLGEEMKHRFQMVILDEAHKIKDPSAKQTKIIHEIFPDVPYKVIMTGTPIGNILLDLHQPMTWLDPFMFEPFYAFRAHHFYAVGFKHYPMAGTEKMMQEKVYTRAVRYRKDECLDLPAKTYITRSCTLSAAQNAAYKQMLKQFVMLLDEGFISAKNVLSQIVKLSEITSGFIRDENGRDHIFKSVAKLELLKQIVDEIGPGHKMVIWARYVPDIKRIAETLGLDKSVMLYGATAKDGKALDIIDEFSTNPNKLYCVGNPAVGGLGLNMTVADYAIYYSNDYSWIKRSQSEDRIHRMGAEKHQKITIIDMISEMIGGQPTIDLPVVNSLRDKKELARVIIDTFKGGIDDAFSLIRDKKEAEERLIMAAKDLSEIDAIIDFSRPDFAGAFTFDEPECPSCKSKNIRVMEGEDKKMICRTCESTWD